MGKLIERIAKERGHICGPIAYQGNPVNDKELATADVAIEFSAPDAAEEFCRKAIGLGIPTVSGTTGWDPQALQQKVGVSGTGFLHATNMSLGVNAVFAANRLLAKLLGNQGYQITIQETHHIHKLDKPSGTAVTLAEEILEQTDAYSRWELLSESPSTPSMEVLPVRSQRVGEVFGDHTVQLSSKVDQIELTHHAKSREGFGLGAVLAAEYMVGKRGIHTMGDVLNLSKRAEL